MAATYKNDSDERRVWPNVQVDGHSLELAPGETVELPDNIEVTDPVLVRVEPKKTNSTKTTEPVKVDPPATEVK